ncbi:LmbU family transcriptional regulator [Streptomyces sp. NPDC047525]|uniref:LmbU family transcriptional regulator n=1 Tax=Streptomyces sp. NPDC047525 TaxID=3155264 RepID=UPI0033E27A12
MDGDLPVRNRKAEAAGLAQHEDLSRANFNTSAFVTGRGLLLPRELPFDTWVGVGSYLSSIFSSSAWCLGDWLVYGEASFNGRYHDAIQMTSLDYQTLRNHAWVARRFQLSRRRDRLSFTHHAEVAALAEPEQDFWLGKAEDQGWSAKRLRREVKASLHERSTDTDGEPRENQSGGGTFVLPAEDTVQLRLPVPSDVLESCHEAASKLGLDVGAWVSQVLLAAAQTPGSEQLERDPARPGGEGEESQTWQGDEAVRRPGRAGHVSTSRP